MKKQKLLYIGHAYHNKTKSTQFLKDMLAQRFDVEIFDFDPYKDDMNTHFVSLKGQNYDVVVIFQIMPHLDKLKKVVNFKRSVFFPMYDGVPARTDNIWAEYKDTQIINFCRTLHEELQEIGFSSHYIQYFPEPITTDNMGKTDSVFLWQRINQINADLVAKLLAKTKISHLHFHKAIDPTHKITLPQMKCKITTSEWFDTREEMQAKMQESALYIAPRLYEGIGMSFLEAMAMGRLVIAPNNPTMNEYIEDGKTGILYDPENPQPLEIKQIKQIQKNTLKYIENGYKKWAKEKHLIIDWIEADLDADIEKIKKYYAEKAEITTYKLFNFLTVLKSMRSAKKYELKLLGFFPLITIRED